MRLFMGIVAAILFALAGYLMVTIESEAGNTVAEAFYNAVGVLSFGLAALSVAVALPPTVLAGVSAIANEGPVSRVTGWYPDGERLCPHCGQKVAADRKTHCNRCGRPLVVRRTESEPVEGL